MTVADDPVDVLIIGAGASGAALAWTLAETRMRIVCLEQGDWMNPSNYPSTRSDWELHQMGDFALSPNTRMRPADYPINDAEAPIAISNFNAVGGSTIIPNSRAIVDDLTLEEWDNVIEFNLRGTFLCTNAVIKRMKQKGTGKIINLSSVAGHGTSNTSSAYATAKAGIMAFTKKVAVEAGPYGVTCNAIAPGMTLSDRIARGWEQRSEEEKRRSIESIPLGRPAEPEDQAKVIAFLASSDADYVTGVTIDVNGGQY